MNLDTFYPQAGNVITLESLNCTHGMNVEVKHHRFGSHFSPVMCVVKYFLLAAHARGAVNALFHSSQKQARCENFHPITIFESTHCKLARWLLQWVEKRLNWHPTMSAKLPSLAPCWAGVSLPCILFCGCNASIVLQFCMYLRTYGKRLLPSNFL